MLLLPFVGWQEKYLAIIPQVSFWKTRHNVDQLQKKCASQIETESSCSSRTWEFLLFAFRLTWQRCQISSNPFSKSVL